MTCLSYVCLSSPSMLDLACTPGHDKGARMRASPTVQLQAIFKRLLVSCLLTSCLPKKVTESHSRVGGYMAEDIDIGKESRALFLMRIT